MSSPIDPEALAAVFVTTKWAAWRLGCSKRAVQYMTDSGRLRAVRTPASGYRLIVRDDVEAEAARREAMAFEREVASFNAAAARHTRSQGPRRR